MKFSFYLLLLAMFLYSCKKDRFTTAPQISYRSVTPNAWPKGTFSNTQGPQLSFQLRDAEGDFGFQDGKDTSYVYVKTYLNNIPRGEDSLKFPSLTGINRSNLNVDINVLLSTLLITYSDLNVPQTDTFTFDVYVRDFANNKSNTITTDPVYYYVP